SCGFHLPAVSGDAGKRVIGVRMVCVELEYGAVELFRLMHVAGLQQSPGAGQRFPDGGGNFLGRGGGAHADGGRDYASSIIPLGTMPPGNEKARIRRAFSSVLEEELLLLLASNGGLETGTGGELRHGGGRNLDRFAGLRVLAGACSTLGRLEGTETNQGDRVALGHSLDNSSDDAVQRLAGGGLANVGFLGGDFDQFSFVHLPFLPFVERRPNGLGVF